MRPELKVWFPVFRVTTYLLAVYLNIKDITIDQILILQEDIGLIGSGHNCIVSCLEFIYDNRIFHTHSILHDSYGRIFQSHNVC